MRDIETITAAIEATPGWAEAKAKHFVGSKRGPDKYFRTRAWVEVAVRRWMALEPLVTPNFKVLDIGAGFGYFAIVGKAYTDHIDLVDVPHPIYDEVTRLLELPKYEQEVRAFTPFVGGRYDLITAHRMVFDKGWGQDEWQYFLRDVRDMLNEGGSVVLGFNNRRDKRFMKWAEPFGALRISEHDVLLTYEALNG